MARKSLGPDSSADLEETGKVSSGGSTTLDDSGGAQKRGSNKSMSTEVSPKGNGVIGEAKYSLDFEKIEVEGNGYSSSMRPSTRWLKSTAKRSIPLESVERRDGLSDGPFRDESSWSVFLSKHHQWCTLVIALALSILGLSLLESEQIDILLSWTFGWFMGGGSFLDTSSLGLPLIGDVELGYNSVVSVEHARAMGVPALIILGLSMLCAGLGWLQEFWSDIKARLFSRSSSMILALISSFVSLFLIQTKAEEVLAVALSLSWVIAGIFHRIASYVRVGVGRAAARLSPEAAKVHVAEKSAMSGTGAVDIGDIKPSVVDVRDLKVGDVIILQEGAQIPCDGVVVAGAAIVREVRFSPLGRIVNRCENDKLYAGGQILRGCIELRVNERFGDSDLAMNLTNLEKTLNEPIPEDLNDYKLQRKLVISGITFSVSMGVLYWLWYSSLSASFMVIAALLIGLVVVSSPSFFFPIRRLCLLRAFSSGAFVSKASSINTLAQVEQVVVDMSRGGGVANFEIRSFKIFDDTLDSNGIIDLLLALLARIDPLSRELTDSFWYSLHDSICRSHRVGAGGLSGKPVRLDSFTSSSRGLYGEVEGLPVFLGDVQFLLEHNVVINVGDVPYVSHPEKLLMLAMGREAIAALVVIPSSLAIEASDLKRLREWGYKVSLVSDADRKEVDIQGKVGGFDLGSIHGGLVGGALEDKLRTIPSAAIFSSRGLKRDTGFMVVPFDEVRREFEDGDVTLFSRSIRPLVDLLGFSKQAEKLRQYLLWSTFMVSVVAVSITIAFPQLMWLGAVLGGLCNLTIYLFLQLMSPKL